uniref:Uncharacterized protein n=1 Tax=Rhizophora mucronata TaxID=61149 RepID=A0A2P2IV31_RHIMU
MLLRRLKSSSRCCNSEYQPFPDEQLLFFFIPFSYSFLLSS